MTPLEQLPQHQTIKSAEDHVVLQLAFALDHIVSRQVMTQATTTTLFDAVAAAPVSVLEYMYRVWHYSKCTNEVLILAAIYIDRIVKFHPGFPVHALNIHRLLLTALTVAVKYQDDVFYDNAAFAQLGGIGIVELNKLEAEFLKLLRWHLYVRPEVYERYRVELSMWDEKWKSQMLQGDKTCLTITTALHAHPHQLTAC
eukprot:GILK01001000.1.p1 GENE.GILK01001000.1~~GILK01001000.1.p1  ORF type:complete len:199 (+),score=30.22 GILK01001000.1:91-687(+)